MTNQTFNPFTDRLSRDIRNALSESILDSVSQKSIAPSKAVADTFLSQNLPPAHRNYIIHRLSAYSQALSAVQDTNDHLQIAVILWDLELFFEVHEVLEPAWMKSKGDEKLLLQALIRAAGVYINLELGYLERGRKISIKAIPILQQFKENLSSAMDCEDLIKSLQELTPNAPKIGGGTSTT